MTQTPDLETLLSTLEQFSAAHHEHEVVFLPGTVFTLVTRVRFKDLGRAARGRAFADGGQVRRRHRVTRAS